jgi:hypothetical protein
MPVVLCPKVSAEVELINCKVFLLINCRVSVIWLVSCESAAKVSDFVDAHWILQLTYVDEVKAASLVMSILASCTSLFRSVLERSCETKSSILELSSHCLREFHQALMEFEVTLTK